MDRPFRAMSATFIDFPPHKIADSKLKQVHTPFRTDSEYEKELAEQLPATEDELKLLEQRYGDS
eukprot:scaffold103122_cov48-Cyclotella_meneghiniana.AAC.4